MGNLMAIMNSQFPPKAKWTIDDVPDLTGKVACVTGGYGGIGYEITRALLQHGAKVYMAGRSEEKAKAAITKLTEEIGKDCEVYFLELDLADILSTVKAAHDLSTRENRLDILINNAGVMMTPEGSKTKQGFELQWGTNVVGHYVFTKQLMPLLLFTAHRYPLSTRVIWISSIGHVSAPKGVINFDDVNLPGKRNYFKRYGQSKAAALLLATWMAAHFSEDGLLTFSVHPGSTTTDLTRTTTRPLKWIIEKWLMRPAHQGAITPMYAATYADFKKKDSGRYFIPWARIGKPGKKMQDIKLASKLWEFLDKSVGDLPDKQVEES